MNSAGRWFSSAISGAISPSVLTPRINTPRAFRGCATVSATASVMVSARAVGDSVGGGVGDGVGNSVGSGVKRLVGAGVGECVGDGVSYDGGVTYLFTCSCEIK